MRSAQGAICLTLFVSIAHAMGDELPQKPLELAPGARVRVSAPSVAERPLVGTIAALDDRTFTLEVKGRADRISVPRDAITKLDLSTGRRSRGKGTLIGAGIGVGAGVLIGLLQGSDDPNTFLAFSAGDYALIFALLGAPTGALIGLAVPPGERWKEVSVSGVRVGLGPTRGHGIAISASLAF